MYSIRSCFRSFSDNIGRQLNPPFSSEDLFPLKLVSRIEYPARLMVADPPNFDVEIDMYICNVLQLPVRVVPMSLGGVEVRRRHRGSSDPSDPHTYLEHTVWSPPLMVTASDSLGQETESRVRDFVGKQFDETLLDEEKWNAWAFKYYSKKIEDFQCDILLLLGKFYRQRPEERRILKTALSLLWFDYLMVNHCQVSKVHVPLLRSNLEKFEVTTTADELDVVPGEVIKFLNAVILQMAVHAANDVTERLTHMANTHAAATTEDDVATCLMFVLMMFVGSVQAVLILLASTPEDEIGTVEDGPGMMRDMEEKIFQSLIEPWRSTPFVNFGMADGLPHRENLATAVGSSPDTFIFMVRLREIIEEYGEPHHFWLPVQYEKLIRSFKV
jgi:hypothetical protein